MRLENQKLPYVRDMREAAREIVACTGGARMNRVTKH